MKSARGISAASVAAVLAVSGSACSNSGGSSNDQHAQGEPRQAPQHVKLIGDGSMSVTGPQPHQPRVRRLKPGQRPPQFVVFSWDGAGENDWKLFSHFRKVGRKYHAAMTYFLSGIYVLPESKRTLYHPPRHRTGAAAIGFLDDRDVRRTIEQVRQAWLDGSEIGTHFNGHFCGPDDGVGTWSVKEWKSEIRQAEAFVARWRTNTGFRNMEPLPFDYRNELVGGRAPCLEGQDNLIKAARELGWRYDASSQGGLQVWPGKREGVWDFPLQEIPMPGHSYETLSMDYNFLANQSETTQGDPAMYDEYEEQTREGFLEGFERAYKGNRAPLFIGNHFEQWNGGAYMRAVEDVIKTVCTKRGVRCVSFKQLSDWLDVQDPRVLAKLRTLNVGEAPDWATLLSKSAIAKLPKEPSATTTPGTGSAGNPADGTRDENGNEERGTKRRKSTGTSHPKVHRDHNPAATGGEANNSEPAFSHNDESSGIATGTGSRGGEGTAAHDTTSGTSSAAPHDTTSSTSHSGAGGTTHRTHKPKHRRHTVKRHSVKRETIKRHTNKPQADRQDVLQQGAMEQNAPEQDVVEQEAVDQGVADQGVVDQGMAEHGVTEHGVVNHDAVEQEVAEQNTAAQNTPDQQAAEHDTAIPPKARRHPAKHRKVIRHKARHHAAGHRASKHPKTAHHTVKHKAKHPRTKDSRKHSKKDSRKHAGKHERKHSKKHHLRKGHHHHRRTHHRHHRHSS
jgi:hypothetical protein